MFVAWNIDAGLDLAGFGQYRVTDGRRSHIWARGYFFDTDGTLRIDGEIGEWLAKEVGPGRLDRLVPGMNGCFSVVVVWPDAAQIDIGLDRLAAVPLYYHLDAQRVFLSDDFWQVARQVSTLEYDPDAVTSMALVEYVTGPRTLLRGISELQRAATHRLSVGDGSARLQSRSYWSLTYQEGKRRSADEWRKRLAKTLEGIFRRYGTAIRLRGWTVHIPLSGGQDSRLAMGLLHKTGVDLRAFSYGPPGNEESVTASRVAGSLGIPFRFVPVTTPDYLTPALIRLMTSRVGMRARFTAGIGGQLSLSGYSPADVYMPGHPRGLVPDTPPSRVAFLVRTEKQAVQQLVDNQLLPVSDLLGSRLLPMTWGPEAKQKVIRADWDYDPVDPLGSMHRWEYNNTLRKLTLSEMRTYEEFGHWLLPFCDYEFIDFFHAVPARLRYYYTLYADTIARELLVGELEGLRRIPIAYKGNVGAHRPSARDWVGLHLPKGVVGDWLVTRADRSKVREHQRSIDALPKHVSGPDPFDHWWLTSPGFRQGIIEMLRDWDGMRGIVDVQALVGLLGRPLPRLFVRLGIPAFLTLRSFQELVETEIRQGR